MSLSIMSGTEVRMEYPKPTPMNGYTEPSIKRTHSYTFPKQLKIISLPGLVEYDPPCNLSPRKTKPSPGYPSPSEIWP